MADELLTPDEAAEWLRVTQDTVYRWLREGELPAIKLGRMYRIPKAEVLALVRRHGVNEEGATKAREQVRASFSEWAEALPADLPGKLHELIMTELPRNRLVKKWYTWREFRALAAGRHVPEEELALIDAAADKIADWEAEA